MRELELGKEIATLISRMLLLMGASKLVQVGSRGVVDVEGLLEFKCLLDPIPCKIWKRFVGNILVLRIFSYLVLEELVRIVCLFFVVFFVVFFVLFMDFFWTAVMAFR